MRQLLVVLLLSTASFAAQATITVLDGSGAPVRDVLIVLKSLDHHYEDVSRRLTDEQGRVRPMELKRGFI